MRKRKVWLPKDIKLLMLHYSDTPMSEMMKLFDRNSMSISNKAYDLGLKRSDAFLNGPHGGRIKKGETIGKDSQFKPGMAGWNKGKKQSDYMSAENIEKTKLTRFKKGNVPLNHKPIGHERITRDGYIEVKVRDAGVDSKNKNFELKHRLLWKQHHGDIPEGMNVEFVTGADKINFSISDLVLRTKKENMIRNVESDNAIIKRFLGVKQPEIIEKIKKEMPELIDLKRNSIKLNKQLNNHE